MTKNRKKEKKQKRKEKPQKQNFWKEKARKMRIGIIGFIDGKIDLLKEQLNFAIEKGKVEHFVFLGNLADSGKSEEDQVIQSENVIELIEETNIPSYINLGPNDNEETLNQLLKEKLNIVSTHNCAWKMNSGKDYNKFIIWGHGGQSKNVNLPKSINQVAENITALEKIYTDTTRIEVTSPPSSYSKTTTTYWTYLQPNMLVFGTPLWRMLDKFGKIKGCGDPDLNRLIIKKSLTGKIILVPSLDKQSGLIECFLQSGSHYETYRNSYFCVPHLSTKQVLFMEVAPSTSYNSLKNYAFITPKKFEELSDDSFLKKITETTEKKNESKDEEYLSRYPHYRSDEYGF